MGWKPGVRRFELPRPPSLHPTLDVGEDDGSYEATIASMERRLRSKQPRVTGEQLLTGWQKEYSHRLAPGAHGIESDVSESQRPRKVYYYRIAIFLEWCQMAGIHPLHVGYNEMVAYRDYTKKRPLRGVSLKGIRPGVRGKNKGDDPKGRKPAPGTVLGHLIAVTHFYDYLVDVRGLMLRNHARAVMLEWKDLMAKAPPRPRRRAPDIEQFGQILECCPGMREFSGFSMAGGTGTRNTEFRLLKDTDVYIDERWIRLTPIPGGKRVGPAWDKREAPKPIDNSFWLPITKEQAWVAEQWLEAKQNHPRYKHSPYLFPPQTGPAKKGRPISEKGLNDAFQQAVMRTDIPVDWSVPEDRLVFHSLRHLTETNFENATRGLDGEARYKDIIDALRGDSDRSKRSANTYRHFKPQQLQDFVDEFTPEFGLKNLMKAHVEKENVMSSISDLVRGRVGFAPRRVA